LGELGCGRGRPGRLDRKRDMERRGFEVWSFHNYENHTTNKNQCNECECNKYLVLLKSIQMSFKYLKVALI
jgi:hypothetical protein